MSEPGQKFVVVGTSGSTDYLRDGRDGTGDKRFWSVAVPPDEPSPDDGQACDGLHDETAPAHYLCTRCFPDPREDLGHLEDDEVQQDDEEAR